MKDVNGVEYVMVPKSITSELATILDLQCPVGPDWEARAKRVMDVFIAAAPPFVPPPVTDEVARHVFDLHFANFGDRNSAHSGRDMIAAVQQVIWPQFGIVPASEIKRAFTDGYRNGFKRGEDRNSLDDVHAAWVESETRKRIEGGE